MKKILLISLVFSSIQMWAQVQNIRGNVRDVQSKYPIPGVIVKVLNIEKQLVTTTDQNGDFYLMDVPVGRVSLAFNMLGYKERIVAELLVQQGKEALANCELEENIIQVEEVVIKANSDKTEALNEMATVSARQFNVEETGKYAGSLNDPSRMASNFAGVSGANDGRNDIVIRGNSPTGLLWRMDGIPIPNPNHFGASGSTGGPVSMLNNNLLANSDFMTGAFPSEYGNAISGVFDINMRTGNTQKREYLGQIGFNGFELGAEGPFSKKSRASYLINYRYSTLAIFKLIGLNTGTGAAIPQYQDLSLKLDFPTNKFGRFSLFAIGGLSYIELLDSKKDTTKNQTDLYGNGGFDIYFRSNTGIIGTNHTYFYNKNTSHKIGLMVSGNLNTITQDSLDAKFYKNTFDDFRAERSENRVVFTFQINKKFSTKNTLHSGIFIHRIGYSVKDENYASGNWTELRGQAGASILSEGFVQWKHRFNEKLTSNVGIHAQRFEYSNANAIEPRAGIRYQLSDKQSISLASGIHNQMQPLLVYFSKTPTNQGIIETNKNLDFTRSLHVVLGYDYSFAPTWRTKIETYYQRIDRVPVETNKSSFSMLNAGADFFVPENDSLKNNGTGSNIGLEVTLEKFLSKGFYTLLTTSLFDSKYKGSDGIERGTAFNTNYVINFLLGKEFKLNSKIVIFSDVKSTVSGGRRYTPIDLQRSMEIGTTQLNNNLAYSAGYGTYSRTDFKLGVRIQSGKLSHDLSINVQNITNHKNTFMETYDRKTNDITRTYQLPFQIIPQYKILF